MTDPSVRCPRCGEILPTGGLSGHCPRCLVTTALFGNGAGPSSARESSGLGELGDYELLEEIARGGAGVVYRARQKSLNRLVAVKMLLAGEFASAEFVRRFQREAKAAARLQHPNIVQIYEVGEAKGQHYFSMELIEGSDLAALVRENPLAPKRAARYVKSIAEAVQFAHDHGILHRDLKPSNILVDPFDEPRATDFGLARDFKDPENLTLEGKAFGSPAYMSPEHARGEAVTAAADIYSLGALLFHVITGRPPFQSETIHGLLQQVQEREPLRPRVADPDIPRDLETICLKCLEKNPTRRFQSAQELTDELDRFLKDEPIRSRPVSPAEKAWRWARRRPATAALTVALILAVTAGMAGVLNQWRRATHSEQRMASNLYAADMRAAANALSVGDLGETRRLLAAHVPKQGEEDLREFTWYYLFEQCQGEQAATLPGHDAIVASVAFARNGRWAASGDLDGHVIVWDIASHTQLHQFKAPLKTPREPVWDLQFSEDSGVLMAAGFNRRIQLWETGSWRALTNFPGQLGSIADDRLAAVEGSPFPWALEPFGQARVWNWKTGQLIWASPEAGRRVALSPSGQQIALAMAGETPEVRVYEIGSQRINAGIRLEKAAWSLDFSPDGLRLAMAGWNRNFVVCEVVPSNGSFARKSGVLTPTTVVTNAHAMNLWSARFSSDGQRIVTTSSDRTIKVWDTRTLRALDEFKGHGSEVWCAAFSPDGKNLLSGGKDLSAHFWNLDREKISSTVPNMQFCRPIFSPNGQWLLTRTATKDHWTTQILKADTRATVAQLSEYGIGFSPDSMKVGWFEGTRATLAYAELTNLTSFRKYAITTNRLEFPIDQISANGRWFFCVDSEGSASVAAIGLGGEVLGKSHFFPVLKPPIRVAEISPDGRWLALAVERDFDVHLYDVRMGGVRRLVGHRDHVTGLTFSPDSKLLATGSVDAKVRLFDTATAELTVQLSGHLEEASDVSFSPDGKTLASIGNQSAIKLWHVQTGREIASFSDSSVAAHVVFSPDGQRLAASKHPNLLMMLDANRAKAR